MKKYLASAAIAMGFAGVAHAADDGSLTMYGITLYGTVDIGLQYQTHGAPVSDYFPPGTEAILSKNSNKSILGVSPSNLGQSKIGLKGSETIDDDLSAVFKVETFFNPNSGDISDARKAITLQNGVPLSQQTSGADSSVNGQTFTQGYVGISSKTYGTVTFGRQNGLLADNIAKYDPQGASNAFSPIGFSGTAAGGGDTDDRRLDNSIKYLGQLGMARFGGQYQFQGGSGSTALNDAYELDVGADYAALSVDVTYTHIKDAVSAGCLNCAATLTANYVVPLGLPLSNSLAGTISDNSTYSAMATYNFGAPKAFAGYEHITYGNPSNPIAAGTPVDGGYVLATTNNNAYATKKVLQIAWVGLKYSFTPKFDLTGAFYHYDQNNYATAAQAPTGCTYSTKNSYCSGTANWVSLVADYRLTKRFDVYTGAMWNNNIGGQAAGFIHRSTVDPTVGVRFNF